MSGTSKSKDVLSRAYEGVKPLKGKERVAPVSSPSIAVSVPVEEYRSGSRNERVRFETHFEDGWMQGWRHGASSQVCRKLRKQLPDAKIDLHGLRSQELEAELRMFFSRRETSCHLLLIHGKGIHSGSQRAVLPRKLLELLSDSELSNRVVAFVTAPERLGGAGALLVQLKKSQSDDKKNPR